MGDTYVARATLVYLRVQRLERDAQTAHKAGDVQRLSAIRDEMEVALQGIEDIYAEQLIASLGDEDG